MQIKKQGQMVLATPSSKLGLSMSLLLSLSALTIFAACQLDEIAVSVKRDRHAVVFGFSYAHQSTLSAAFTSVPISSIEVKDRISGETVWAVRTTYEDQQLDRHNRSTGSPDTSSEITLRTVVFGEVPEGFIQTTPHSRVPTLHEGHRYLVHVSGQRSQGLTEFTLEGECQRLSLSAGKREEEQECAK